MILAIIKALLGGRKKRPLPQPLPTPVVRERELMDPETDSDTEGSDPAPKGWAAHRTLHDSLMVVPADLTREAQRADALDATELYGKSLVWHHDAYWLIDLAMMRGVIQIAQTTRDPDIALIEIATHLLDWTGYGDTPDDEDLSDNPD